MNECENEKNSKKTKKKNFVPNHKGTWGEGERNKPRILTISSLLCASHATDHFSKLFSDIKYSSQEQEKESICFSITMAGFIMMIKVSSSSSIFFFKKKDCLKLIAGIPIHLSKMN